MGEEKKTVQHRLLWFFPALLADLSIDQNIWISKQKPGVKWLNLLNNCLAYRIVNCHVCVCVGCHSGQSFLLKQIQILQNVQTSNMCMYFYLLVIAVVSNHLVGLFIFFHFYAHYFITVTMCVSYLYTNMRSLCTLQEQHIGTYMCNVGAYMFSNTCQICVHCSLLHSWL